MSTLIVIGLVLIVTIPISILWVKGITNMKENHPNYKGEDFLNWGSGKENEEDKNQIM